jgi:hypothetical protein
MKRYTIILGSFVHILAGCASQQHFSEIPITQIQFEKPMAELLNEYPGIERFTEIGSHRNAPPISELNRLWGPPYTVETDAFRHYHGLAMLSLMTLGLLAIDNETIQYFGDGYAMWPIASVFWIARPFPPAIHVWRKADKEIRVRVERNLNTLYEQRVYGWSWKEMDGD